MGAMALGAQNRCRRCVSSGAAHGTQEPLLLSGTHALPGARTRACSPRPQSRQEERLTLSPVPNFLELCRRNCGQGLTVDPRLVPIAADKARRNTQPGETERNGVDQKQPRVSNQRDWEAGICQSRSKGITRAWVSRVAGNEDREVLGREP